MLAPLFVVACGDNDAVKGPFDGLPLDKDFSDASLTAPVHVARSTLPKMKHLWWYPYDDATTGTLRAVAELYGASTWRGGSQVSPLSRETV